eukprot:CAMPEP_0170583466 /NCGR_PEP_ID=MMETSP0224-20130122/8150_1 /TAXON_ID=285029 /ORGANISM="Togula jolla, Strain CCCM 725" /LENGTH=529 /DNA_ID=CAMNT_0010906795 /DNA_START=23 /DNA_END=1612 /DNA_ORIENTATION=-
MASGDSLLSKMGGEMAVDAFVDLFYDMMVEDSNLGKFFARFNLQILKDRTVAYLVGEWGGTAYNGIGLFEAHAQLHITKNQFDIMMICIKKALKKLKHDKRTSDEIVKSIELMRDPITDPGGKFKQWYVKKLEDAQKENESKQDLVQTPMGFSIPRAKLEEQLAKEKKQKELNEKLAAKRIARERALLEGTVSPTISSPRQASPSPRRTGQAGPQKKQPPGADVEEKALPVKESAAEGPKEESKRSSDKSRIAEVKSKASVEKEADSKKKSEKAASAEKRADSKKKLEKEASAEKQADSKKKLEKEASAEKEAHSKKKSEKEVNAKSSADTARAESAAVKKRSSKSPRRDTKASAATGDVEAELATGKAVDAEMIFPAASKATQAVVEGVLEAEAKPPGTPPVQDTDGSKPLSELLQSHNVTEGCRTPVDTVVADAPQLKNDDVARVSMQRKGSHGSNVSPPHEDTDGRVESKLLNGFSGFSPDLTATTIKEPPPQLKINRSVPRRSCFLCKWMEEEEDATETTWGVEY